MRQGFHSENQTDDAGNPSGGGVTGRGLLIKWQNGPLGRGEGRVESNGAFVEDVIAAALQRIQFYQTANDCKFECEENDVAIDHLQAALDLLDLRTRGREAREVEGTHLP